ncbi:hypothetical protein K501DRAFT_284476 [Backusella circina FSU 941]|nr:hypothetical protein K501DRAFT_284476 [Backusella circina FSU 941]
MHFPHFKGHHHKDDKNAASESSSKDHKEKSPDSQEELPKGFANDAMRSSNKPDTLYNFDDPMARRLGPVPTTDPTNTGA